MTDGGPLLSRSATEVLWQLFTKGAVWDGDLVSKEGRTELVDFRLALRHGGFNILTLEGLKRCIALGMPGWDAPKLPKF